MIKSLYRSIAALALFWLFVFLPAAAPADEAPYELNGIFSTTGFGSFLGASAGKAFKALETYVNQTGGIHGRPVKMIVLDDQSSPQVAVQLVNGLIAKKVAIIMGPMLTASCNAALGLLAKGPVAYCVSPFISPPAGSFMFAQGGSPGDAAVVALRYLKERGIRRVAMLNSTDATGQAGDRASVVAFTYPEFRSMQLVAHQYFAPTDTSVSAQLAQIKSANPQALISWNVGSAFGTVIHGVHDAGLESLPIVTAAGNAAANQMRALAGFKLDDVHYTGSPSFVSDARVPKDVLRQQAIFQKVMTAAGYPADGAYAAAFDITLIEITALRSLPPDPTAEQLRNAIAHISHYVGANGVYDFRFGNQSGAGQTIFILLHWDAARGQFVASSTPGGHVLSTGR